MENMAIALRPEAECSSPIMTPALQDQVSSATTMHFVSLLQGQTTILRLVGWYIVGMVGPLQAVI